VATWWLEVPRPLPAEVGLNRVNWNIRYDNPPAFNRNYAQVMSAVPHETPYTPAGPLALPGAYTARLTVDGRSYLRTAVTAWRELSERELPDLNALLARNHLAPIQAPAPSLPIPACGAGGTKGRAPR
jgi:hypothetical protein